MRLESGKVGNGEKGGIERGEHGDSSIYETRAKGGCGGRGQRLPTPHQSCRDDSAPDATSWSMNQHRCLSASGEMRCTSSTASGEELLPGPVREYGRNSAGWSVRGQGDASNGIRSEPHRSDSRVRGCGSRKKREDDEEGSLASSRTSARPKASQGRTGKGRRVTRTFRQDADVLALHAAV